MPENGHEFRFVIAGTKLSSEHQERIAGAIARAGAEALAGLEFETPQSAVHFIPPRWLGIWIEILEQERAGEIAKNLGVGGEVGFE